MKRLLFFLFLALSFLSCHNRTSSYHVLEGFAMGTTYRIVYDKSNSDSVSSAIAGLFARIDSSLSIYNPQSIIAKVNQNEPVAVDSFFKSVFVLSQEVWSATRGAFDISASPLFDAWGFGAKNRETMTPAKVDSLKEIVGMERVWLEGDYVRKEDPRITLSANAIAKGFGTDVIADYLEQAGAENYLVEVGGEIRCKGRNDKGESWSIGIDKPVDGNIFPGAHLQVVLQLSDKALATSGNYRKYYEENGKKYVHTIHPATGYPVTHNLLSATVVAKTCALADAFATAFMVVGVEEAKKLLDKYPELDAYLVYDNEGEMAVYYTPGVAQMIRR